MRPIGSRMQRGICDAAPARPRALLLVAAAVLALAATLAVGLADRLALSPPGAVGSESERVDEALRSALGREPDPGMVVVTAGPEPARSAVSRVALEAIVARAEARSEIAAVKRARSARGGHLSAVEAFFRESDPGARDRAIGAVAVGLDSGPLDGMVGGPGAVLRETRDASAAALARAGLVALAVAAVALLAAFGLRLAAAPLLAVATGICGSAALIGLLNELIPVSALALVPAGVVAIVVGIESCHLLRARFRSALAGSASPTLDLRRALEAGSPAVLEAGLATAVVAAALAAVPVAEARAAAVGAALGAACAAGGAVLWMPALLGVAGRSGGPATAARRRGRPPSVSAWRRIAAWLGRTRAGGVTASALALAVLASAALPLIHAETLPLNAAALPEGSEPRRAEVRAASALGAGATGPIVVRTGDAREAAAVRDGLLGLPGVAAVEPTAASRGATALQVVAADAAPGSIEARELVRRIRAQGAAAVGGVGGSDARALDADRALRHSGPLAAVAAVILLLALLLRALPDLPVGRRIMLAVALGLVSLLPAAAALGLLVVSFQQGGLAGQLGHDSQGGPLLAAALASVAAVAAVGVTRTLRLALDSGARPLGGGPGTTGTLAATAVCCAAAVALLPSGPLVVAQLGVGVGAGLALDALLVRMVVIPGLARLGGIESAATWASASSARRATRSAS